MKLLVVFAAALLAVNASSIQDQWVAFKQTHGKTYRSLIEERLRFQIFQDNVATIEEHNAKYQKGESLYSMGVNQFADMSKEEFKNMLRLQAAMKPELNATLVEFPVNADLPVSFDWRRKSAVLPVKDQGPCGSCWAFSATGALEGQNAILNNVRTPLSDQQLLDCSQIYGNGNCQQGGHMINAYRYVRIRGIQAESTYKYEAQLKTCRYSANKVILNIHGYGSVQRNEEQVKQALAAIGPLSIAVEAEALQFYRGGILDSNCGQNIDHAVLLVGYGVENNVKYWTIKNSWGVSFGEAGYFRVKRNHGNLCGVATDVTYPILNLL